MKQNNKTNKTNENSTISWKKLTLVKINPTENNSKTVYNTLLFTDSNATVNRLKKLFIRLVSVANDPALNWLVAERNVVVTAIKRACCVPSDAALDACIGIPFWANIETRVSNGFTNHRFQTKDADNAILSTVEYSKRNADATISEKYGAILRFYQLDALSAALRSIDDGNNPIVVIPTGGGKTGVICALCAERSKVGRVLVLAHRKELLSQTNASFAKFAPEMLDNVGVYSAGLQKQVTDKPITIAGIQTIGAGNNIERVLMNGNISTIIIDEAHRVPRINESACSQYCNVINAIKRTNPDVKIVGLSATPYRTSTGLLVDDDDETSFFNDVAFEIGIKELIKNGFLSPLVSRVPPTDIKSDFHIIRGEFDANEVDGEYTRDDVIKQTVSNIIENTRDRQSVLIFGVSVKHCRRLQEEFARQTDEPCAIVTGESTTDERADAIQKFIDRKIKFLINCDILTTGFDAPNVDCVAILRPTLSPGLYAQMVGRGSRLYPNKKNCIVLDYGGNIFRHGAIDKISPKKRGERTRDYLERVERTKAAQKKCRFCHTVVEIHVGTCPECGRDFGRVISNNVRPTDAAVISADESEIITYNARVDFATYALRRSKAGNAMLSISYCCDNGTVYVNDLLTFSPETSTFNRFCQKKWRALTSDELPDTPLNALFFAREGYLRVPASIAYHIDDKGFKTIDGMFDSNDRPIVPMRVNQYVNSGNYGGDSSLVCQRCRENKNFIAVYENGCFDCFCQTCGNLIETFEREEQSDAYYKTGEMYFKNRIPVSCRIQRSEIRLFTIAQREPYIPTSVQKSLDAYARTVKIYPNC